MQAVCCHEQSCLEDNMTFIMTSYCKNNILSGPTFNVGGLCEILCKVIRDEGVWEQRQTQKTWSLNVGKELFPAFLSKKWSTLISEASRLYLFTRNIGWHKLKNTNPVKELGGLSGYWQPGLTATVLWMVENEQITSAISWTDNTQEGHQVLTMKHVMSVIWDWNQLRYPPRISVMRMVMKITTFVSVALRQ